MPPAELVRARNAAALPQDRHVDRNKRLERARRVRHPLRRVAQRELAHMRDVEQTRRGAGMEVLFQNAAWNWIGIS